MGFLSTFNAFLSLHAPSAIATRLAQMAIEKVTSTKSP
jgi:hypothetical protein